MQQHHGSSGDDYSEEAARTVHLTNVPHELCSSDAIQELLEQYGDIELVREPYQAGGAVDVVFVEEASAASCLSFTEGSICSGGVDIGIHAGPRPFIRRRQTAAEAQIQQHSAPTTVGHTSILVHIVRTPDFPVPVTPYLLYQILRGEGFPLKVVILQPPPSHVAQPAAVASADAASAGPPVAAAPQPLSVKALVQLDTEQSVNNVEAAFNSGGIVRLDGVPGHLTVTARRSMDRKVFATHGNTETSLVVVPQGISRLGPVFDRRWS